MQLVTAQSMPSSLRTLVHPKIASISRCTTSRITTESRNQFLDKLFGGTGNEARLTGFGGQSSALLNPDSTGSLTRLAFRHNEQDCHVWVCRNSAEEDFIFSKGKP